MVVKIIPLDIFNRIMSDFTKIFGQNPNENDKDNWNKIRHFIKNKNIKMEYSTDIAIDIEEKEKECYRLAKRYSDKYY